MRLENKYPVMIFEREYQGNTFYRMGLNKKGKDGKYINGYIDCRFKKDVSVDDKKKIYIKDAWLDFYIKDKATIPYVFINEFEYVEDVIDKSKDEFEITDEELPF